MASRIRIVGLCGSLEPHSNTLRVLETALASARACGAAVNIVDLRELQIPVFNSPFIHPNSKKHVARMKQEFRRADGIIFATPEYHGSVSGALKNALDWMGFEEFEGKVVGLIGVAGGDPGAFNALNHLRTIGRQLHAWVVPSQVSIANSRQILASDGAVKDSRLSDRIRRLGEEVARFALLHKQGRSGDFLKLWEQRVANPGGEGR